jgi:hypothetical protein
MPTVNIPRTCCPARSESVASVRFLDTFKMIEILENPLIYPLNFVGHKQIRMGVVEASTGGDHTNKTQQAYKYYRYYHILCYLYL